MRASHWRWWLLALVVGLLLLVPHSSSEVLSAEGREQLRQLAASGRFRHWDLVGSTAFAIYGFFTAVQRRYDLWGTFVLTLVPTVGGGVIRDLLIGGDRIPLLMFQDPSYLAVVLGVIVCGTFGLRCFGSGLVRLAWPARLLLVADAIGLASFAVIGTRVALLADLPWYWLPFSAAVSCTGGGALLDVITGREPRTFQGEPYEEIAALGSVFLIALWCLAEWLHWGPWGIPLAMLVSWLSMVSARLLVLRFGWRSWRLGAPP